jgi:4-hydroxy-tetrahydrodipicolinate synthase
MKDSSGDWLHMQQIINRFPDFKLLPGTETFLLDILRAGGQGCISATLNITAEIAKEIYQNWKNTDMTLQMNALINIRKTFASFPMIAALKSIMAITSGKQEWRNVRPPLERLGNNESQKLYEEFSKFNLIL